MLESRAAMEELVLEIRTTVEELLLEVRTAMEELMLEIRTVNVELEEDLRLLPMSRRQPAMEEALTEVFTDVFTDTGRTHVIARTWTCSSRTWRPSRPLRAPQATTRGPARGGLAQNQL